MIKLTMQQLVDFLFFEVVWNFLHIVKQIVARVVTDKLAKLNTHFLSKMVGNISKDVGLGGSSETTDRRNRTTIFAVFSNKFDCI